MIVGDGQLGVLPRQLVRTASFLAVINTMYDLPTGSQENPRNFNFRSIIPSHSFVETVLEVRAMHFLAIIRDLVHAGTARPEVITRWDDPLLEGSIWDGEIGT